MKIVTLVENTCGHEGCIAEHGLSLYIETEKHKLLLDTGQTDAVVKNARVLGIDLSAVDTVININMNVTPIMEFTLLGLSFEVHLRITLKQRKIADFQIVVNYFFSLIAA